MSGRFVAWGYFLVLTVIVTIGLFHLGVNFGGAVGGAVHHVVRWFGAPLWP